MLWQTIPVWNHSVTEEPASPRLAHSGLRNSSSDLLLATTEFTNCSPPKPKVHRDTTDFGRNRMSAESAHLSTFGAETETEAEIRSTSTADQLVRLESCVREAFVHKQHVVAVFFDLEKAYDTTWRHGIMKHLYDAGLRGRLPLFVQGFLQNTVSSKIGFTYLRCI